MDASARGSFVWHELMTTDVQKAGAFYTALHGWKLQPFGDGQHYQLFMAGGISVAGLMALTAEALAGGAPPAWLSYVGVVDVNAIAAEAVRLGGRQIHAPTNIPGTAGRFAVLADPQGACFGIYSDESTTLPPANPPFTWHELVTTDPQAAHHFYRTLFGWDLIRTHDMGAMGDYMIFGLGGKDMGGVMKKPPGQPGGPFWGAYANVPDARKTATQIKKLGGGLLMGPVQVPGDGWIDVGIDPTGATFAVFSAPAKMAAKPTAKPAPKPVAAAPKATAKPAAKKAPAKKPTKAVKKKAVAKKAAKKPVARKAVKRKAAKKVARKVARKPARKVAKKKVARKVARKPARKR